MNKNWLSKINSIFFSSQAIPMEHHAIRQKIAWEVENFVAVMENANAYRIMYNFHEAADGVYE